MNFELRIRILGFCFKLTSFVRASHFSKYLISSVKEDNPLIPHRVTLTIELDMDVKVLCNM